MLYVSRVADNGYYITDSKDDIEEFIDRNKLLKIVKYKWSNYLQGENICKRVQS